MATMLQLVQQVTGELGLPVPATVAGNPNQDVSQILALMNACGYELLRRADWRQLTKQHTFYTEATSITGSWTTASTTLTVASSAGIDTTYQVSGQGIPNACTPELKVAGALADVAVVNPTGQPLPLPAIEVAWRGTRALGADATADWVAASGPEAVTFRPHPRSGFLAPGERRVVGWVRLTEARPVSVRISGE